jgi:hypothetical protein
MCHFLPYSAFLLHTMRQVARRVAITSWIVDLGTIRSTCAMRASSMRKEKPTFVGYIV